MAVVGTAGRELIIYQLENRPQEFTRIESPLKFQVGHVKKKMEQIKFEFVLRHANGLYFHFTIFCKNCNICIVNYLHSIWLHLLQCFFICRGFSLKCILNAMSEWYNCSFTAPCCQHIPRQEEHWGSHGVCSGQHWGTSSHTLC